MDDAAVKKTFVREGHEVSRAIATLNERKRGTGSVRTAHDYAALVHDAVLISWSDDVELGLAIAVTDIAAGRRLLEWIRSEVYEHDANALANTEASVASFMRVLDR